MIWPFGKSLWVKPRQPHTLVLSPDRERLVCMWCPHEQPLPARYRVIDKGAPGGKYDTIEDLT